MYKLLAKIRSSETNSEMYTFTDATFRELTNEGNIIRIDDMKRMIDGEFSSYNTCLIDTIFFGEDIPDDLIPSFEIEDLIDNMQNRSTGYSFVDDDRNNFAKHHFSYGRWLLSDSRRAQEYVYSHDGKLYWKPSGAFNLLKRFEHLRSLLIAPLLASTGPTSRGAEFSRQLYRNTPDAPRNVMILYHVLCIVAIQDKTSHRSMKDRFVPHTPTREWATALITNLVLFRPFEEFLVGLFMGDDDIDRYRYQLWPCLKTPLLGTKLSELFCNMTARYIGQRYGIQAWRGILTAIGNKLPNARNFEIHKEYYLDTGMMHSSDMSEKKYGRGTDQFSGTDSRVTKGCIEVSLAFHKHLNIGQQRPFIIQGSETETQMTTTATGQ